MKSRGKVPVTVRFDREVIEALRERAEVRQTQLVELIRQMVMEVLFVASPEPSSKLLDEIAAIRSELLELRKDIAVSTEAILVDGGNVEPELARSWVERNLLEITDDEDEG